MSEREQIFEMLFKFTQETGIAWEVNFDDFEILSVNFTYVDESTDEDEE